MIGFNLNNLPSGTGALSSLLFVICLGAIVGLFSMYWFVLNIFQTLQGLLVLLPITGLVGTHALSHIQATRLKA
jgi:hypothetical protein